MLADPDHSACWFDSFRAGRPVAVEGDLATLMVGLACGEVSLLAWEVLKDHSDAAVAVPDAQAVEMMRVLALPEEDPPLVAEGSAVAGLAALKLALADPEVRKPLGLGPEARALVFGTEGDSDAELYRELVGADADAVRRGAT